jgi:hypothetical protein
VVSHAYVLLFAVPHIPFNCLVAPHVFVAPPFAAAHVHELLPQILGNVGFEGVELQGAQNAQINAVAD